MSLIVDITAHPARLSSIPYATLYRVLAVLLVLIAAALTWSHFGNLDPLALTMPSLAISCAAREALHQADVVETMLRGIVPVIRNNDLRLSEELRKLDDVVDELYSAIKFYLTQISGEALSPEESRRWTDIVSFTINMEQIGDIIERVLQDIEDKKVKKNRSFSEAGMGEIVHLHERLLANLRLAMSVFLDGHVRDAKRLLEEKAHFRTAAREHGPEHRDQLAAPRPDQRPEAHQLAHLRRGLPDPRVGRRAHRHAHPPVAVRCARAGRREGPARSLNHPPC